MKKNIKKGFTLSEVLVTMVVLGIIAAIALPIINSKKPNQELVMLKKAYYITERIVSELINDDDYYPDSNSNPGFSNLTKVTVEGVEYGHETRTEGAALQKFCNLFSTKLNLKSDPNCGGSSVTLDNGGHFTSSDGIVFLMPITNFDTSSTVNNWDIQVDVNGSKGPNCAYSVSSSGTVSCQSPDRFTFKLYQTGRITATGTAESDYLQTTRLNKKGVGL